jgi:Domain of unknown function (DUF5666)
MQNENQIRALDVCIQNMQAGQKLEDVLEIYPKWASDLRPSLEAVQTLLVYRNALGPSPSTDRPQRTIFLNSALQIKRESSRAEAARSRWTWLGWTTLIFLITAGVLWGFIMASLALPGDTFYPLKGMFWQVRQDFIQDPQKSLEIDQAYDRLRLDEIRSLGNLNRQAEVIFAGPLIENQLNSWDIAGWTVQILPQTQIIGKVQDDIWVEVSGELLADQTIVASAIRPREYTFSGTLQAVSPDELLISGIPVKIGSDTLVHGSPMAGSQVHVITLRDQDGNWIARLIDTQE